MGLRGIERVTDIHHTTVMGWVRTAGLKLPDVPEPESAAEPLITDLDELQTFVGNKRHKIWRCGKSNDLSKNWYSFKS